MKARFKIGERVRVDMSDDCGIVIDIQFIAEDDEAWFDYYVEFPDGNNEWYTEDQLERAEQFKLYNRSLP